MTIVKVGIQEPNYLKCHDPYYDNCFVKIFIADILMF